MDLVTQARTKGKSKVRFLKLFKTIYSDTTNSTSVSVGGEKSLLFPSNSQMSQCP